MATVLSGQSQEGREAAFLANTTKGIAQKSAEAQELADNLADGTIKVTCADCGGEFKAGELDISCTLCETCMEIAGIENEEQDGLIGAESAEKLIAKLRATQGGDA